jgi:hypothetical protein
MIMHFASKINLQVYFGHINALNTAVYFLCYKIII